MTVEETKAIAIRALQITSDGNREEFDKVFHADFVNREAEVAMEPSAAAGRGPEAAWAVAQWLRSAFEDLRWDVQEVVAENDLVAIHCVASGRNLGEMPLHEQEGAVADVLTPSGREFTVTQTHWMRIKDGKAIEHWANRDDLGTARQLGWLGPDTRTYLRESAR